MAEYHFVSIWQINAPIERVWKPRRAVAELVEVRGRVDQLEPGAADGMGKRMRLLFRTRLPYTLGFDVRVTRVHPPSELVAEATGELAGTGRWTLTPVAGGTVVRYWDIRTTRRWMNLLAPVARPVFRWNHDELMRAGGQGLARQLGADLTLPDTPSPQPGQARAARWAVLGPRGWDGACWDGAGASRRDEPGGRRASATGPRRHRYASTNGPRPRR